MSYEPNASFPDYNVSDVFGNGTNSTSGEGIVLSVSMTVVYAVIFLSGLLGNISTCIVISKNKSMHTATNYYLFSLAISDLLLLISGLPPEMYNIWSPNNYVFGEAFCILQGFAAETSANATVLTITAFTIERYVAICHPFLSHTMSKLSRAIKYIIAIWILALCLAAPQAIQFGLVHGVKDGVDTCACGMVEEFFNHAFEISGFLFFVGPMTLITVLYVLIAIKLRKSRLLALTVKRTSVNSQHECSVTVSSRSAAQNRVIKMLVAVVVAFFICWAPFHAQRLLAVYLSKASQETQETLSTIYIFLIHTSGILYFLSTTINPVLYHIMSNKFREAFKNTLMQTCGHVNKMDSNRQRYSVLSRYPQSLRNYQRSVSEGLPQAEYVPCSKRPLNRKCTTISQTTDMTVLSEIESTNSRIKNGRLTSLQRELVKNARTNRAINLKLVDRTNGKYYNRFLKYFQIITPRPSQHNKNFLRTNGSDERSHSISNSSLQDLEETEFSSSDLMKYMEEVNEYIT